MVIITFSFHPGRVLFSISVITVFANNTQTPVYQHAIVECVFGHFIFYTCLKVEMGGAVPLFKWLAMRNHECAIALHPKERLQHVSKRLSGGVTCLTLLVEHTISSKVMNNTAKSTSRIRQVMPQKAHEAVLDWQLQTSNAIQNLVQAR